jgi:hypothetical protein
VARIHGRRGALYMGIASDTATAEPVAYLNSWSLSFATDNVDVTAFGDTNKVYVSGLPDVTGSYSGWYDTATAQMYTAAIDGLPRKFYLYPTSATPTTYFWGTATFDFTVEVGSGDGVSISGDLSATSTVVKAG